MQPPEGAVQLAVNPQLLPPAISDLHSAFAAWGRAGWSPGPLTPVRVWVNAAGALAVEFLGDRRPVPLMQVGSAPDLAAWLVLLNKYMETFVVIARAREVWTVDELAGALGFLSPAYLPPKLVRP